MLCMLGLITIIFITNWHTDVNGKMDDRCCAACMLNKKHDLASPFITQPKSNHCCTLRNWVNWNAKYTSHPRKPTNTWIKYHLSLAGETYTSHARSTQTRQLKEPYVINTSENPIMHNSNALTWRVSFERQHSTSSCNLTIAYHILHDAQPKSSRQTPSGQDDFTHSSTSPFKHQRCWATRKARETQHIRPVFWAYGPNRQSRRDLDSQQNKFQSKNLTSLDPAPPSQQTCYLVTKVCNFNTKTNETQHAGSRNTKTQSRSGASKSWSSYQKPSHTHSHTYW